MAKLCWSKQFIGKFAYAAANPAKPEELKALAGAKGVKGAVEGVLVVHPDAYGLKGKVVAATTEHSVTAISKAMKAGLTGFVAKEKDSISHIRKARSSGIRWKPEVMTDAMKARR